MLTTEINAWRNGRITGPAIRIRPGTLGQVDALMPLHYRGGRPATMERILSAVDTDHGILAGVLVTSRPVLNGSWRKRAWGDRFCTRDRRADAKRVNQELRTISRVIVDPRFRGLGVGTGLVRAYLRDPDTPCTESITALGRSCPIFEHAGMRPIELPDAARDRRLVRAIGSSSASVAVRHLLSAPDSPRVETALRIWARASASTRRRATEDARTLAGLAAGALLARPRAFVHGSHLLSSPDV